MAVSNTKKRMFLVYQMLLKETDEKHTLNAGDIIDRLQKEYEIKADRRSIYSDIDTLIDVGVDIVKVKGADHGFFIGARTFEMPELKILIDAVQVSRFLTNKKSKKLINSLTSTVSKYDAAELKKQVTLMARPKTKNERVVYNIDIIHRAIYQKRRILFQYAEWTVKKDYRLRKNGKKYDVTPVALIWDDENYYLNAYDSETEMERHYRVDKIVNAEISEEPFADVLEVTEFDAAAFSKKTFGMFGGVEEPIVLYGKNELVGIIIDRFGQDVSVMPADPEHFRVVVPVAVSQQFFGWLTALGDGIKITKPENVVKQYQEYLGKILEGYQ